jgi:hypothetical protein
MTNTAPCMNTDTQNLRIARVLEAIKNARTVEELEKIERSHRKELLRGLVKDWFEFVMLMAVGLIALRIVLAICAKVALWLWF